MRRFGAAGLGALVLLGLTVGASAANGAEPPAPRVETVDFRGNQTVLVDHQKNVTPEKAIGIKEFGGADEIEWKSLKAGETTKNWPVAYAQKTTIKLEARFALEAATRKFLEELLEGETTITGEAVIGGVAMTVSKKLTVAEVEAQLKAHKEFLTTGEVEFKPALPEKAFYEKATIAWKWSVKEKGREKPYEQALGKSTHNLYVTANAPLGGTTEYLTLLDLDTVGVEKEKQPAKEAETIAGVWRGFNTVEAGVPSVHLRFYNPATGELNRGGIVLRYYFEVAAGKSLTQLYEEEIEKGGRNVCKGFTTQALLETGEGRCGGWEATMENALATEGIKSELVHIFSSWGKEKEPCVKFNVCVMLVKAWAFGVEGAGEFPFAAGETKDAAGVAGQGIKNPSPFFWDHAILKAGPAGASALYDPSYGTGPFRGTEGLKEGEKPSPASVLKEYQTKSIDGYCRPAEEVEFSKLTTCQRTPAAVHLTPEKAFEFP